MMPVALQYGLEIGPDRDRLIRVHQSLAARVVDRMMTHVPAWMSRDDMLSAAMAGLMDAANRYDAGQGAQFRTFAEKRIRGAVLDEVRRMDWCPRSLRTDQSRVTRAVAELENELGRSPKEREVADRLGLNLQEYQDLLSRMSHLGCVSLEETIRGREGGATFLDGLKDGNAPCPEQVLEQHDLTRELAGHLDSLTEKERLVVAMVYYEELSQKEAAEVLGLTPGRVSQLHSQALIKLRSRMKASGGESW
ncbi:MAG TPA: FliA/WhiG family RNA polymerase sigma factor [Desulfomicrobiaceae bacterium]|nr:FliA/WhiG family RNA polymerase sigma factor [Desulfomicrobiaceae bacterium]